MVAPETIVMRELGRLMEGDVAPRKPDVQRQVRRYLQRMDATLFRDWRAGRPIQRKQNLALLPVVWRAYGLKIDQRPPASPKLLVLPTTPGHDGFTRATAEQALLAVAASPPRDEGQALGVVLNAMHSTLFPIWTYMSAQQMGTPNVFAVRDSLVEKLLNTDIDNVRPEDVRLPFPGVYISMPFGEKLVTLRNQQTGHHEVSFIGVAEGTSPEGTRALFCTLWGEPKRDGTSPSDDHIYSFSFDLPDGSAEKLKAVIDKSDAEQRKELRERKIPILLERDMAHVYDESFDFFEAVNLMRRLVVNFCLYVSSPHPDIEPSKSGQPQWGQTVRGEGQAKRTKVRVSRRRRASRKKKAPSTTYEVWDVGRNVEKLRRVSVATDILVRGHFRRQAYGEGRRLRRVIWIEPHIRLPSDDGDVPGHEYEVTSNAGS